MSNRLFRGDIYWVNFKGNYDNTIKSIHPCLITNSIKSIQKADSITVLPITSNTEKFLQSHVAIEGYGLDKPSKVLCEQIVSISKSDLQGFIGHIDNVKMLEIGNCLRDYLQLQDNNKTFKSNELEQLFMTTNNSNNHLRELELIKNDLMLKFDRKLYEECKSLSIELIEKSKMYKLYYFGWYGYYSLSLLDIKSSNFAEGLANAQESLKYIPSIDTTSQEYIFSMFSISRCFEVLDSKKAVEIYYKLSNALRAVNDYKRRISILWNINILNNNKRMLLKLIWIVEKSDEVIWYDRMLKSDILLVMYKEFNQIK